MAEPRRRGRPTVLRDRQQGRLTYGAFKGKVTVKTYEDTVQRARDAVGAEERVKAIEDVVALLTTEHLDWRGELGRRTREWAERLQADNTLLARKWVSVKPKSRRSKPAQAPALDEYQVFELAHQLALRAMSRSATRRAEQRSIPGARPRISDDRLRAALAAPRVLGAGSVKERAKRVAEVLGGTLSVRQLETRIARLSRSSVAAK